MTREEALVKIGSAVTLINDVAEKYKDDVGRSCSEGNLRETPVEQIIKAGAKILTDAIQLLKCEDAREYIKESLDLMLKSIERRYKDGGNDDDIEMPF